MNNLSKRPLPIINLALITFIVISVFAIIPNHSAEAGSNSLPPLATICYVKWDASGANNGTSWTDAYNTGLGLQFALADSTCDQIWVAAGGYAPGPGTNRLDTFQLKNGVVLYGGFAGTETSVSERDIIANETILSGGSSSAPQYNVYHVVTGSGTDNTAVLDGFIIANGYANGTDSGQNLGGGMYISNGSPSVYNVTFRNNYAANGGGLFTTYSATSIWGVIFDSNTATYGGGVYSHYSTNEFGNVTFIDNHANQSGGAILNTGGNTTFKHLTIKDNTADSNGGGMYLSNSDPTVSNTIFWGNTASGSGDQIHTLNSSPTIKDSVVEGGYAPGTNIIADNPFLSSLNDNGGRMQTISIRQDSSARDAANLDDCPYTDQRGLNRPQGDGCDIGAYEFQPVLYVVPDGRTSGFCQSWSFGCDLQYALNEAFNKAGQQIWVKTGTYTPTTGTARTATFTIGNGEQLYGGFAGTETSLGQRDYQNNITTLSGEIGTTTVTNNSYHVVTNDNCFLIIKNSTFTPVTILDGFTITRGYANGTGNDSNGGGIYAYQGCSILRNVTVKTNYAASQGGGIWHGGSSSLFVENATIASNQAGYGGGGLYNDVDSSADLTNVTFIQNSATSIGGGMFTSTDTDLTDVTFVQNVTPGDGAGLYINGGTGINLLRVVFDRNVSEGTGGGLYFLAGGSGSLKDITFIENQATNGNGGGMYIYYWGSGTPAMENLTFVDNLADNDGGGAYFSGHVDSGIPVLLTNATFVRNTAARGGGMYYTGPTGEISHTTMKDNVSTLSEGAGLYYDNGYLEWQNSIFWGNSTPQITNATLADKAFVYRSVVQAGYPEGSDIITTDPMLGTLSDNGGFTKTIPISQDSSALDVAPYCRTSEDQRGIPRPQGELCDMGAFEYYSGIPATSNDNFDYATDISTLSYIDEISTLGATVANDDPAVSNCGLGTGVATVWYKYKPSADSAISLDTFSADYDTFIAVWTGGRGNLVPIACNNDANGTKQSAVAFQVTANETYYIEIGQPALNPLSE